jgi:hypothetical protein
MSHADQLLEIATELAMDAKDNVADLQRKLSAIETAKVEIEARLHIANWNASAASCRYAETISNAPVAG